MGTFLLLSSLMSYLIFTFLDLMNHLHDDYTNLSLSVKGNTWKLFAKRMDMLLHKNILEKLKEVKLGSNVTDDSDQIQLYEVPT